MTQAINIQKEPHSSQLPKMDLIYNTCISWSHLLTTKNHSFKNTYPPKRKVASQIFQNPFSYFCQPVTLESDSNPKEIGRLNLCVAKWVMLSRARNPKKQDQGKTTRKESSSGKYRQE